MNTRDKQVDSFCTNTLDGYQLGIGLHHQVGGLRRREEDPHRHVPSMTSRIGGVGSAEGPGLKPTGFLTNSPHVARELRRRRPRTHAHVPLVGGRAAGAAIYPHR